MTIPYPHALKPIDIVHSNIGIGTLSIEDDKETSHFVVGIRSLTLHSQSVNFPLNFIGQSQYQPHRLGGDLKFKILSCITDNCDKIITEWIKTLFPADGYLNYIGSTKKNIVLSLCDNNRLGISKLTMYGSTIASVEYRDYDTNIPLPIEVINIANSFPTAVTRKVLIEKINNMKTYENILGAEINIDCDFCQTTFA